MIKCFCVRSETEFDRRTHIKKLCNTACACDPSDGKVETGEFLHPIHVSTTHHDLEMSSDNAAQRRMYSCLSRIPCRRDLYRLRITSNLLV